MANREGMSDKFVDSLVERCHALQKAGISNEEILSRLDIEPKAEAKTIEQCRALLAHHMKGIERHRDALRSLQDDIDSLAESSDRGVLALSEAIDALSESV